MNQYTISDAIMSLVKDPEFRQYCKELCDHIRQDTDAVNKAFEEEREQDKAELEALDNGEIYNMSQTDRFDLERQLTKEYIEALEAWFETYFDSKDNFPVSKERADKIRAMKVRLETIQKATDKWFDGMDKAFAGVFRAFEGSES